MKHKQTNDVTRPSHPRYEGTSQQPRGAVSPGTIEPNATVQKSLPPIEPAKVVSGQSTVGIKSVEGRRQNFTLPERVSAGQIQQESFKYGGGRSAGRLSTKR